MHIISLSLPNSTEVWYFLYVPKYVTSLLNNCPICSTYQLCNKYQHAVLVILLKYKLARTNLLGTLVVKKIKNNGADQISIYVCMLNSMFAIVSKRYQ